MIESRDPSLKLGRTLARLQQIDKLRAHGLRYGDPDELAESRVGCRDSAIRARDVDGRL